MHTLMHTLVKLLLFLFVSVFADADAAVESPSHTATHSGTPTKTATKTATSTETSTSSATKSALSSKSAEASKSATSTKTLTSTSSSTPSGTASSTSSSSSTASASATKSAISTRTASSTSSASATATATTTATQTPSTTTSILPLNLPASQGLAAGTFFAGSAIGVSLFLCLLCFLVPNQLKKVFDGLKKRSRGGFQGSAPEEESLLTVTTINPRGPSTMASAASDIASLQAQLTEKSDELDRVRAIAFSPVPAEVLKAATTVSVRSSMGNNGEPFWDRREFLQSAGSHVSLLVQLLDESLVDAFSSSKAIQSTVSAQSLSQATTWPGDKKTITEVFCLAQSLSSLMRSTVSVATGIISSKTSAVAALSLGVGNSPSVEEAALAKSWASSAPATQFVRNSLQVQWTSGAIKFEKSAETIVDAWIKTLGSELSSQLGKEPRAKLIRAVSLHLKLELWVASCDNTNVSWSLRGNGNSDMVEYNSEEHNLFSFSGRTHAEGTPVLFIGPELCGPVDVKSRATRALVFCS
jgi:hypothetical protein